MSEIIPRERIAVIASEVDESVGIGETPGEYCRRIAREKVLEGWERYGGVRAGIAAVIGADTVVVLGVEIFGQPRDRQQAMAMLTKLNGLQHSVMTGVCVLDPRSGRVETLLVESRVWVRKNDLEAIEDYVMTGEPMDKAGAYALQGRGRRLIDRYEGSRSNIIGLPLDELKEALSRIVL